MRAALSAIPLAFVGLCGCATAAQETEPAPGKALLERFDAKATAQDAALCLGAYFNTKNDFPKGTPEETKNADASGYWLMQLMQREPDTGRQMNMMLSGPKLLMQVEDASPEYHVTDEIIRRCEIAREGQAHG